jgi:hypothetical protein
MLNPVAYRMNYHEVFDRIFGHQLSSNEMLRQKRAKTKLLWEADYPDEPFDVDRGKAVPVREKKSAIPYNLMAATKRQELFYYQVSPSPDNV